MTHAAEYDMELRDLLPGLAPAPPSLDVTDIATHSGEVVPGALFLACAGTRDHGLRFLDDALAHGARAVAWEPAREIAAPVLPDDIIGLRVPGLGRRLGDIASRFFAAPSASLSVTGITGTNGKTTVAWLVVQALERLGLRAAYMGTLGYGHRDAGATGRPDDTRLRDASIGACAISPTPVHAMSPPRCRPMRSTRGAWTASASGSPHSPI